MPRKDMNISIRGFLPLAFDEGKEKVEEFDSYVNSYIIVAGQKESPTQEQKDFERRLRETKTFLTSWKDELNLTKESNLSIEKSDTSFQSNEVFIVHGHDDKATLELENLIRRLELKPVILHRQPDKGRTIIEKLEAESKGSHYAFILLTPDE